MNRVLTVVASLFLLTAGALANGELDRILTAADKARLKNYEATREEALAEAKQGPAADQAVLAAALEGEPLAIEGAFDPLGTWTCRVIKAGGLVPLIAYPAFKCVIAEDGVGWTLKKITGSQRTEGRFYTMSAKRLVYVGAGHVAGEPPRRYGDDAQQNQVAITERLAENRIILLFPEPQYESKIDILVLER